MSNNHSHHLTPEQLAEKIASMRTGGAKLRTIRDQLQAASTVGTSFAAIEDMAQKLITAAGATPNFSLVPGYKWAICINKNEGIVHGIPDQTLINDGDLISIDLGLIWQGWNLDTSISFIAGTSNPALEQFLEIGRRALQKTINQALPGNTVYDLSRATEKTIRKAGADPSHQLAGHYIGRQLHESPLIPNVAQKSDQKHLLRVGDTIALEVMYAAGRCDLELAPDGWTYRTKDRSLTGLFEHTILVTETGPEILT